jgi:hypothetical protein
MNRINGKEIENILRGKLLPNKSNNESSTATLEQQIMPIGLSIHQSKIRECLENDFHCRRMGIEKDIFINKHYASQLVTQDTHNTNQSVTNEPNLKQPDKDQG